MSVPNPYAALLDRIPVRRDVVSVLETPTAFWTYGPADARVTLLLVHGFRGDHHGLEPLVAQLPDVRIISPDLPGFGETPPVPGRAHSLETYVEWLTAFAAEVAPGAIVVGHSFGSIVSAAAVAGGLPTPKLILINPIGAPALEGPRGVLTRLAVLYYRAGAKLPKPVGEATLRNPLIVRIMSLAMVKTSNREIRAFVHNQHDTHFSRFADRDVLSDAFLASVSNDVRASAPKITQPTLLVAAEKDDITPIEAERALRELFPQAQIVEIPEVGHLIHYETPAQAASAIRRFLELDGADTR